MTDLNSLLMPASKEKKQSIESKQVDHTETINNYLKCSCFMHKVSSSTEYCEEASGLQSSKYL